MGIRDSRTKGRTNGQKSCFLCFAFVVWFACKPSTMDIAKEIEWDGHQTISYRGKAYHSNWGGLETVEGYVRVKERHYKVHMPIVTHDFLITSGEFSDPEVVKIRSKGGGSFMWRSNKRNPKGSLVAYHAVPTGAEAQQALDGAHEGSTIELTGWISQNNEIKGSDGSFVKLLHDNHKFILVKSVETN